MADISGFATKDRADEGVIFPVVLNKKKLPMAIKIYGDDSDVVQEYNKEKLRKMNFGKNGELELDADTLEDLLDSDESVLVRIGGMWSYDLKKESVDENDPLILDGKTIECNKKSYSYVLKKVPALKEFVIEKAKERSNFLA